MTARRVSPWFVLVIVGLAQFMVVLDATIVNVAMPSIQRGLHFSTDGLQWVVTAYALTFGGFLLLGGRAGDLFGRRRLFALGVVLFSLASLFNGLSQSAAMLVIGRGLQGIGGALVSPAALSVLTTTFSEGRDRARALAVWSAVAVGGGAVGLVLGGVLTQLLSWQWIFFVNVPVGAATLLLALRYVPESRAPDAHGRIDVAGAVTVTAGLMLLVYAVVNAQSWGWTSGATIGLGTAALAMLAGFAVLESRRPHPLVRLGIFRLRTITAGNSVMLLVAVGMFAMFFFAQIYVQEVQGYTPLTAGLAFLPMTGVIIVGAAIAQAVVGRLGVRRLMMAGLALGAVGQLLLTGLPVHASYAANLLPGLLVTALGMGFTFVPVTLLATSGVEPRDAGLASGLLNTSQQIGGALGLAVLSTLAANATATTLTGHPGAISLALRTAALVDGFHVAFFVGGVLMAVGVLVVAAVVRGGDAAGAEVLTLEEEPVAA